MSRENGFETTLRSKAIAVSVFKNSSVNYLAIYRDDIKTLFCESEAKPSK